MAHFLPLYHVDLRAYDGGQALVRSQHIRDTTTIYGLQSARVHRHGFDQSVFSFILNEAWELTRNNAGIDDPSNFANVPGHDYRVNLPGQTIFRSDLKDSTDFNSAELLDDGSLRLNHGAGLLIELRTVQNPFLPEEEVASYGVDLSKVAGTHALEERIEVVQHNSRLVFSIDDLLFDKIPETWIDTADFPLTSVGKIWVSRDMKEIALGLIHDEPRTDMATIRGLTGLTGSDEFDLELLPRSFVAGDVIEMMIPRSRKDLRKLIRESKAVEGVHCIGSW